MKIFWYDFEGIISCEKGIRLVRGTVYAENIKKAVENLVTRFGSDFIELSVKKSEFSVEDNIIVKEDTVSGKYIFKNNEKIEKINCNDVSLHKALATLLGEEEDALNDILILN